MKLTQLRYFIEICRCKSVTRAAQELHISQPSLSNSIKKLEDEFGVLLFERTSGGLRLTREGEHFLVKSYELVNMADALLEEMRNAGVEKRKITIGMTPMIGAFIFPQICGAFSKLFPDTEFQILEEGAIELHKLLTDDKVDIAITITTSMDETLFHTRPMIHSQYCLCMNDAHYLARLAVVSGEALRDIPLALLSGNTYHSRALFNRIASHGIEPRIAVYSNQLNTIVQLVQSGAACSFLLREAQDIVPGIAAIPFDEPIPADIALVWKKNKSHPKRVQRFIEFVRHSFSSSTTDL